VLLVLLGLAFGLIMEVVIESLLTRLLLVVLAAAVGFWALNNVNADIGPRRPIPEVSSTSSTEIKKEQVQLEDVQLSQSGFGAYTLSGNVSNDSLKDCRGSNCRIVGQEDTSASVDVPPQQMRAFGSAAISFNDLPDVGPARRRSYSYIITSLRGRPDTDRQHQANATAGIAVVSDR
jgi:hypothetical protein